MKDIQKPLLNCFNKLKKKIDVNVNVLKNANINILMKASGEDTCS